MNAVLRDTDAMWRRELKAFDRLAAAHPASLNAARKLRSHGRIEAAIQAYRAALLLDSRNSAIQRELSMFLASNGRRREAREVLAEACKLDAQQLDIAPGDRDSVAEYLLARELGAEAPARAPAAYVRALFDRASEEFDERLVGRLGYRTPWRLSAAVERRLGAPAANLRILDAGCGTGLAAEILRPLARELDGVDLSPAMIAKARGRRLYDQLIVGELHSSLAPEDPYDLIFAADVFSYIGDLQGVFCTCHRALTPNGVLAFSVEAAARGDYALGVSGRYRHAAAYLRKTLTAAGFAGIEQQEAVMRREAGKPVASLLLTAAPAYGK